MELEKILNHRGDPVAEPSEFSQVYSDGVDGWIFWISGVPLDEKMNEWREFRSGSAYYNEGIKPPRPGLVPKFIDGQWFWSEA